MTALQFAKLTVIDNALAFYTIGCTNVVYGRLEHIRHEMRCNGFCSHRTEMHRHPFRVRSEKLLHQLFAKGLSLCFPRRSDGRTSVSDSKPIIVRPSSSCPFKRL